MRRIPSRRLAPFAGNVLTFDHDAVQAGRAVFYDALVDSAPHVLNDLDRLCRDAARPDQSSDFGASPAGELVGGSAGWAVREVVGQRPST